jgi:hypothetical protein
MIIPSTIRTPDARSCFCKRRIVRSVMAKERLTIPAQLRRSSSPSAMMLWTMPAQRLAQCKTMPTRLLLGNLHRSSHHLLAVINES